MSRLKIADVNGAVEELAADVRSTQVQLLVLTGLVTLLLGWEAYTLFF